jgi:Fur family ferric uptake transcriptional regulator
MSDNSRDVLISVNLKVTKGRRAIIDLLASIAHPYDIQEIQKGLKLRHVLLDTVTVYRIIEVFIQAGIVRQIDFREGKYRYELASDHHHHFVCRNCGLIEPIHDVCVAKEQYGLIENTHGVKVEDHSLEFFGLCSKCRS